MTIRRLTTWERALARSVFGEALEAARVRLVLHRARIPFAVTLGRFVTLPGETIVEFAGESLDLQAWLIHELTHVWQFQTAPRRTLVSWAKVMTGGGYGRGLPAYRYALPAAWDALNLEQQAAVVEDTFRLRSGLAARYGPRGARLADYAGLTPFPITGSP